MPKLRDPASRRPNVNTRLSAEMRRRLEESAAVQGLNLSREVERRLELSFQLEATRQMIREELARKAESASLDLHGALERTQIGSGIMSRLAPLPAPLVSGLGPRVAYCGTPVPGVYRPDQGRSPLFEPGELQVGE
ncbi:hypothetical protein [Enterovirga sp. CN4-39]|uniref:hypothetical protein n=1 Tax=Enterovirga sp. CN4-39 TaxID=3400910 RepID=UPI003C09F6DA